MGELPSGTVTFLFTDLEGSTPAMTAQGARLSHDELTARLVDELSTTIE